MDDKPEMQSTPAQLGSIGSYQLIRLIGEGAAGQVFLAEQQQPHRQVAVKVLRSAAAAGRARFEREVELLANLEHNNIARLYDSGTADGPAGEVPYLVMEYVNGQDLLSYANQQNLDREQRLKLLAQVARAAHFAHTRGVIHRDLKPGNILVNARGEPKILDFGVAHVVADDATQMTGAGEILGTLSYMSWEQLCGEANRVDARSDVYALGVIGYQLLAGDLPYPGLREDTLVAALGRLQRENPTPLGRRDPSLAGDIETLISRAMAREPERRYGSAAEFAADVERFLRKQPIEARPPTLGYVLGLFVQRHRALAVGTCTALIAMIMGTGVAMRYAYVADQARDEAQARAAEFEAINAFTGQMLSAAQPEEARGREITVREIVERANAELQNDRSQPPRVRSSLEVMLGKTYQALGDSAKALPLIRHAAQSRHSVLGPDHPDTIDAQTLWVQLLDVLGRRTEADELLTEILGTRDPGKIEATVEKIGLLQMRAILWIDNERADLAVPLLDAVLALVRANPDRTDKGTELSLEYWRGHALDLLGDLPAALASAEYVFEKSVSVWGERSPHTEIYRQSLAARLAWMGDFERSELLFRQAIQSAVATQGAQHPYVASMRANYARMLLDAGRAQEAARQARLSMEAHALHGGPTTSEYARAQATLGIALAHQGATDQAEQELAAVQALADSLGRFNRWVVRAQIWSAENRLLAGDARSSITGLEPLVDQLVAEYGSADGVTGEAQLTLARAYRHAGQDNQARDAVQQAIPALARFAGDRHPLNQRAAALLASLDPRPANRSAP